MHGNTIHGEAKTRLYKLWKNIKTRCYNKNRKQYKDYGGRGIIICPEWTNDYTVFKDWALSNGYTEGLQINRINNNGNYEPSNCNFVTRLENNRNQRKTKLTLGIANEIRRLHKTGNYLLRELAEKYNISCGNVHDVLSNRIWKK